MTQPDKIKNLKDYFEVIRQRPGMYLGTNTISKLYDHLQGFQMAYWLNNFDNSIDKHFFDNFTDFVYSYYDVRTNENWKTVILDQCFNDEQGALATFFELFDTFIIKTKTTNSKKIVLSLFDKLVFEQQDLKDKLGGSFSSVLLDTIDLLKDHVFTNYKTEFDDILEQFNEKAELIPELKKLLIELEDQSE